MPINGDMLKCKFNEEAHNLLIPLIISPPRDGNSREDRVYYSKINKNSINLKTMTWLLISSKHMWNEFQIA